MDFDARPATAKPCQATASASSEILASVADALDTPISVIMREVGDRLAVIEGVSPLVPDTLPDELVAEFDADLAIR